MRSLFMVIVFLGLNLCELSAGKTFHFQTMLFFCFINFPFETHSKDIFGSTLVHEAVQYGNGRLFIWLF